MPATTQHTHTPHLIAKCKEVIGDPAASNAALQVANYLLSDLEARQTQPISDGTLFAGPYDYFVGNANGRGLIRIECGNESADAGEHIASMPRGEKSERMARLLTNAASSYFKHCGPRAIECAEADLLGEAIKALRGCYETLQHYPITNGHPDALKARAILAKLAPHKGVK